MCPRIFWNKWMHTSSHRDWSRSRYLSRKIRHTWWVWVAIKNMCAGLRAAPLLIFFFRVCTWDSYLDWMMMSSEKIFLRSTQHTFFKLIYNLMISNVKKKILRRKFYILLAGLLEGRMELSFFSFSRKIFFCGQMEAGAAGRFLVISLSSPWPRRRLGRTQENEEMRCFYVTKQPLPFIHLCRLRRENKPFIFLPRKITFFSFSKKWLQYIFYFSGGGVPLYFLKMWNLIQKIREQQITGFRSQRMMKWCN